MDMVEQAVQILTGVASGDNVITHVWSERTDPPQNDDAVWRVTIRTLRNHRLTFLVVGTTIAGLIELVDVDGRRLVDKDNPVPTPLDIQLDLARAVFAAHTHCCAI